MVALTHWMFSHYLNRTADVLDPGFGVVFRRCLRLGRFPACWRLANVPNSERSTLFVSGLLQANFHNYSDSSRFMSICCRFVLCGLWNAEIYFQPPFFLIGKILALRCSLCVARTFQSAYDRWQEAWIVLCCF